VARTSPTRTPPTGTVGPATVGPATVGIASPAVQLEPCAAFAVEALGADPGGGAFCDTCGWTADDHDPVRAGAAGAVA
jgi:hypothetical protein